MAIASTQDLRRRGECGIQDAVLEHVQNHPSGTCGSLVFYLDLDASKDVKVVALV